MNSALIKWLYLPDFFRAPNSTNLISKCNPLLTPGHLRQESLRTHRQGGVLAAYTGTFVWNQQEVRLFRR